MKRRSKRLRKKLSKRLEDMTRFGEVLASMATACHQASVAWLSVGSAMSDIVRLPMFNRWNSGR